MDKRKKQKIIVEFHTETVESRLSDDQKRAVQMSKTKCFGILCGIPGSGKSETINHMKDEDTVLVAPTGTAACVMTQKTGVVAQTVAYILSSIEAIETYYRQKFIVDEASMLSMRDFAMLLYHLRPSSLWLVGDRRQLDTVNGFSALKSCLKVPQFPRVELTYNFRTLNGSFLAQNIESLAINGKILGKGQRPDDNSFVRTPFKTDKEAADYIVKKYNSDVQILARLNDDVKSLNYRTASKELSGEERVMCRHNFYKDCHLKVSNGTLGTKTLNKITYDNGYIDKRKRSGGFNTFYRPARCITIHSSQGQEIKKHGIIYVPESSKKLPLSFIYTAISRFPDHVELVGKGTTLIHVLGLDHYQPFTPEEVDERFGSDYDIFFVECMAEEFAKRSSSSFCSAIFNPPPL